MLCIPCDSSVCTCTVRRVPHQHNHVVAGEPPRAAVPSSSCCGGGDHLGLTTQRCTRASHSQVSAPLASRPCPARHACARARAHACEPSAYRGHPHMMLSVFRTLAQAQYTVQPAQGGGRGKSTSRAAPGLQGRRRDTNIQRAARVTTSLGSSGGVETPSSKVRYATPSRAAANPNPNPNPNPNRYFA